jgi:hypothetical protein
MTFTEAYEIFRTSFDTYDDLMHWDVAEVDTADDLRIMCEALMILRGVPGSRRLIDSAFARAHVEIAKREGTLLPPRRVIG